MRRVLVVTWALGTASGVLLGLFGVQLVSSRFATARVSPLSHPEVLHALKAARSVPVVEEVAAPALAPDTAPPSPPTDAASTRPSAEATSSPAPTSPARTLPRPGATAGPAVGAAAAPPSTTTTATATATVPPPPPPTTVTTVKVEPKEKPKSDSKKGNRSDRSTTTTTAKKPTNNPPSPQSSRSRTETIRSEGGSVKVQWEDGKVTVKARWPEAGWEMYLKENGPDKVEVWFLKKGRRPLQVEAWSNGRTSVREWTCSGRWGTESWECRSKDVD